MESAVDGRGEDGPVRSDPPWRPRVGAFRLYSPPKDTIESNQKSSVGLRVIVKKTMLARLTKDLVETFQLCNPRFRYLEAWNPKRYLTSPHVGVSNDGHDNADSDLILSANLVLFSSRQKYIVKELLGQGTFAQVAKCWSPETNSYAAVKIVKNHPAYYRQGWVEISILKALNEVYDPDDQHHLVRMYDYFVHQRHLCISFEMLGTNLYELVKINNHKGLPLTLVRDFSEQILDAMIVLKDAGIIHCDLKPENILICGKEQKPTDLKVIDFGSACKEGHTIYSYIQSRYYRSPEVLLGYPYDTAIDMWSVGCIVAEMFLGFPLFPGASEFDLLKRMIDIVGRQPPDDILRESKNTCKFFKHVGSIHSLDFNDSTIRGCSSAYRLLTEDEYESRENKKPVMGKKYFGNLVTLEEIIRAYRCKRNLTENEMAEERMRRSALIDFIKGLIEPDPSKRWSPLQASKHPFVTGEPFTCPYIPSLETPNIPVRNRAAVEHNPQGGHWAAAGLSPQVSNFSLGIRQSPQIQPPYSTRGGGAGSYCSYGSYGSYNDSGFQGSSSFGDVYCSPVGPPAAYLQAHMGGSILGASPDIRQLRSHQISHGPSGYGFSPTGHFCSMPLGVSPSQFTPPNSQIHVGPISPGSYGGPHGSPLGKGSAFGKQHRKKNSIGRGYQGSLTLSPHEVQSQPWHQHHGSLTLPPHEVQSQPRYQHHGSLTLPPQEVQSQPRHQHHGSLTLPPHEVQSQPRHQHHGSLTLTPHEVQSQSRHQHHHYHPPHHHHIHDGFGSGQYEGTYGSPRHSVTNSRPEGFVSSADPGDWDPNYSDELLLQEDNTDVRTLASEFSNGLHIGQVADAGFPGGGMSYQWSPNHYRPSYNLFSSTERRDEVSHAHSSTDGQSRLSRFGQHPLPRFPHVQTMSPQRDRSQHSSQLARTSFSVADSQPPANRWSTSWGS